MAFDANGVWIITVNSRNLIGDRYASTVFERVVFSANNVECRSKVPDIRKAKSQREKDRTKNQWEQNPRNGHAFHDGNPVENSFDKPAS